LSNFIIMRKGLANVFFFSFLLLEGDEGVGFFCSQCVPKDVLNMFPITPRLIPISDFYSCNLYNVPIYLWTVQSLINFLVMDQ